MARRAPLIKKTKKSSLPRTPRSFDTKWLGQEPELEGLDLIDNDIRIANAYTWYNYFFTATEAKAFTLEWFKERDPEIAELITKASEVGFPCTVGWICRMMEKGALMPPQTLDFHQRKVKEICDQVLARKEVKEVEIIKHRHYTPPAWMSMISELEKAVDDFIAADYVGSIDVYSMFQKNDHPKTWAKGVADFYRPLFDELKLLMTKKDKELNEGYRKLTKAQTESYLKFVASIVDDADRWYGNKARVVRANKAPKKKTDEQILKYFKHGKEFADLKLVSISPTEILKATLLVAYNHKYRRVIMFHAKDGETLSVKGTSIVNYDETKLQAKTLRKPEQQVSLFLSGTANHSKKRFEEIKSKASAASARISEDVLLLRAYK